MIKPGKYNDMGILEYHSDKEYISSSALELAYKSPLLYKETYLTRTISNQSDSLDFGNMVHTLILEEEIFDDVYRVFDDQGLDKRTKKYKELLTAFEADTDSSKQIITQSDYIIAKAMRDNVFRHKDASEHLRGGEPEVSFFSEYMSRKTRIRPDYINYEKQYIVDIKTSKDALYDGFYRDYRYKYHYDLSMALYLEFLRHLYGKEYKGYFLVIDKNFPYGVAWYDFGVRGHERGIEKLGVAYSNVALAEFNDDYIFQTTRVLD